MCLAQSEISQNGLPWKFEPTINHLRRWTQMISVIPWFLLVTPWGWYFSFLAKCFSAVHCQRGKKSHSSALCGNDMKNGRTIAVFVHLHSLNQQCIICVFCIYKWYCDQVVSENEMLLNRLCLSIVAYSPCIVVPSLTAASMAVDCCRSRSIYFSYCWYMACSYGMSHDLMTAMNSWLIPTGFSLDCQNNTSEKNNTPQPQGMLLHTHHFIVNFMSCLRLCVCL